MLTSLTRNLRVIFLFFRLNTLFGGVTDPDPTVADAAIKSKWLIANVLCRIGVLHPAKRSFDVILLFSFLQEHSVLYEVLLTGEQTHRQEHSSSSLLLSDSLGMQ